jgi:acetyl esterase
MTIDAPTANFLASLAPPGAKPFEELTAQEARSFGPLLSRMSGDGPRMAAVNDGLIEGPDGAIPYRALLPARPRGIIVYFHGGGWVLGSVDEFDTLGRHIADQTSCTVVLVGYRLAPEHPFPAAARDALHATIWAGAHREQLAYADAPLIVMGDSSGGNLAAVVAQKSRKAGPDVVLQVLIYPVVDADLNRPSYLSADNQLWVSRSVMAWFWDHYLPDEHQRLALAAPLRAGDLSGVPAAVLLLAEHDVLRDEQEEYARALRDAGVPVEVRCFEGQMHGFFQFINVLPGAADGVAYVARHINDKLHTQGVSS